MQKIEKQKVVSTYLGALAGWVMDSFDLSMMFLLVPILAGVFFPSSSPYAIAGTLSIYFISLIFRPLGGLVFGRVGDRIGRKASMVITLLGLGITLFLTGFLPTYSSVGDWAIALLVVFRVVTGIFAGGEYGNSASIVIEVVGSGERGKWSGLIQSGYPIGYTLAAFVFLGLHAFFPAGAAFDTFGWRWMFYLGIIPVFIGLLVRLKMPESALWSELHKSNHLSKSPIRTLFSDRGTLVAFFSGVLAMTGIAWVYSLTLGFFPTILSLNNFMGFPTFIYVVIVAILVSLAGYLLSGWLSDRIGRRITMIIFSSLAIILSIPLCYGVMNQSIGQLGIGVFASALAFITTGIYGIMPVYLSEKFPTNLRSTGVGISFNGGFIIGSWSSVLLLLLIKLTSPSFYFALGLFVIVGEILILASAISSRETRGVDLSKIALNKNNRAGRGDSELET